MNELPVLQLEPLQSKPLPMKTLSMEPPALLRAMSVR